MREIGELSHRMDDLHHVYFVSNLPPGGNFLVLDTTLAVSGTATSQTCLIGIIRGTLGSWLFFFHSVILSIFLEAQP